MKTNYIPVLLISGPLCAAFTCFTTPVPAMSVFSEEKTEIQQEAETPFVDTSAIFPIVETMPEFNGTLKVWLKDNLKYPAKAKEQKTGMPA